MNTRQILETLLVDDVIPNRLVDVQWLLGYLGNNCPFGAPLFLSMGEAWADLPPELSKCLKSAPSYVHGYQLSMYGLPRLRQTLRDYLIKDHRIHSTFSAGTDFEVAVTWTGTKSVMFDFARMILDRENSDTRVPTAVVTAPGWDYGNVLSPLGFAIHSIPLRADNGFLPDVNDYREAVEKLLSSRSHSPALIAINAQHNPTSINWPRQTVRDIIRIALNYGIPLLLDDAHFGVHDPDCEPTSSVEILLGELASSKVQSLWMGVRSLGKQFRCNGWGIGAIISSPLALEELVNTYRPQYQYNYGGLFQFAMADWLASSSADLFVKQQNESLGRNRKLLGDLLASILGFPSKRLRLGECTPFACFPVPKVYERQEAGVDLFLKDCFLNSGVLFTNSGKEFDKREQLVNSSFVRVFLGVASQTVEEAMLRLRDAGVHYSMPKILSA